MRPPLLILASTSPRRKELLERAGLRFVVVGSGADEAERPGELPRAMVARLAREKAQAVAALLAAGAVAGVPAGAATLIIAADTTVVAPDGRRVLGKPRSQAEARRMLALLSGQTHTVLTGYCLSSKGAPSLFATRPVVRVVRSRVRIRKLTAADIARYVATGEPMDKAGSYAAQGIGMTLIESLSGSYTNVVGLPVCEVLRDLERHFGIVPGAGAPHRAPSGARGRASSDTTRRRRGRA